MNDFDEYPTMNNPFAKMANYNPLNALSLNQQTNNNDPVHAMLVKKHQMQKNDTDVTNISIENPDDIKALEEFCKKYNILGVNFGCRNPRAILQMLKSKMGIKEENPVNNSNNKILLNG